MWNLQVLLKTSFTLYHIKKREMEGLTIKKTTKFVVILSLFLCIIGFHSVEVSADIDDVPIEDLDID